MNNSGGSSSRWDDAIRQYVEINPQGPIQMAGLQASAQLVDRLLGLLEGQSAVDPSDSMSPPGGPALESPLVVAPWAELWADFLIRSAVPAGEIADGDFWFSSSEDGSDPPLGVPFRIEFSQPGTCVKEMWLHNGSSDAVSGLAVRLGHLESSAGITFPGRAVFDPSRVNWLAAWSSRPVSLAVTVPPGTPPAVYRGIAFVDGAPEMWIPVAISVIGSKDAP